MCLVIRYICPLCRAPCGQSAIVRAHDGSVCLQVVELERYMKGTHFENWFCSTEKCGYSKKSQSDAEAEEKALLLANGTGRAPPTAEVTIRDDNRGEPEQGMICADKPPKSVETLATLDLAAGEKSGGEVSDGEARAPCDPVGENMAPPSRISSPQQSTRSQPSSSPRPQLRTQENGPVSPAADADPTEIQLSPRTAARVRELREAIASYPTGDSSKKWYPEEEELLQTLRKSELPYDRIAPYLPRHTLHACRSRFVSLKNRQPKNMS
ncbi:hypothetical protein VTH06DRAFT_5604 [Thermothelomyces fergusii]